jgi:hypothetical protein
MKVFAILGITAALIMASGIGNLADNLLNPQGALMGMSWMLLVFVAVR